MGGVRLMMQLSCVSGIWFDTDRAIGALNMNESVNVNGSS